MSGDERPPVLEWMKADAPSRRHAGDEDQDGRDHATADALHRSDLARDVARAWHEERQRAEREHDRYRVDTVLGDALDRLADTYLPDGPQEVPR